MKNILKWTLRGLLALLVLPVLIYLAWLTGNLRDDEVAPELAAILNQPPEPPLSPAENAFYGFIGIEAPEDIDPDVWGQTWVTQAREINTALAQGSGQAKSPSIANNLRPRTFTDAQIPCLEIDGCLERVGANPEATRKALQAEALLLQRFDALLNRTFRDPDTGPIDFRSFYPPYSGRTSLRLAESRIALWVAEAKPLEAIEQLRKEILFFHAMLKGSRTLVGKMNAIHSLNRRHRLIGQFIALHPNVARIYATKISEALPELPTEALSLREALEAELLMGFNFYIKGGITQDGLLTTVRIGDGSPPSRARPIAEFLVAPFFKPIATFNEGSRWHLDWIRVDDSRREGYAHYRNELAQLEKSRQQHAESSDVSIFSYRNPVGKVLANIAIPNHRTFFFRRDNLIADRLLLQHALDVISGKVALNPTPVVLHQANLLHPFTRKPPVWDETRRELRFEQPEGMGTVSPHAPLVVRLPAAP